MKKVSFLFLFCFVFAKSASAIFCARDLALATFSVWSFEVTEADITRAKLSRFFSNPHLIEQQVKLVEWTKSVKGKVKIVRLNTNQGPRNILYVLPPATALASFGKAFPEYLSLLYIRNFTPALGGNDAPHCHFALHAKDKVFDYYSTPHITSYSDFIRARLAEGSETAITSPDKRGVKKISNLVVDQMILASAFDQGQIASFHRHRLTSPEMAMGRPFRTMLETATNSAVLKGVAEGNLLRDEEGKIILKDNCQSASVSHCLPWWIRMPVSSRTSPYLIKEMAEVQKRIYGRYFDEETFSKQTLAEVTWPQTSIGMILWWGGEDLAQVPDTVVADVTINAMFTRSHVRSVFETEILEVLKF